MRPTIFHLIGPPAVGKYTVGKELARLTGARLVDNHSIANVIFQVLDQDGIKPLPKGVWGRVRLVRDAVLDTMIHLSPRHLSFIFTNYLRGEDEAEKAIFEEMVGLAEIRESLFVPVVLSCRTEELVRRVGQASRRERMKLLDPIQATEMNEGPRFETGHRNLLRLDVTELPPEESARQILAWAERLS
jgi:hypothetical protein